MADGAAKALHLGKAAFDAFNTPGVQLVDSFTQQLTPYSGTAAVEAIANSITWLTKVSIRSRSSPSESEAFNSFARTSVKAFGELVR